MCEIYFLTPLFLICRFTLALLCATIKLIQFLIGLSLEREDIMCGFGELICKREHKRIYKNGTEKLKMFDDVYPESDIMNEALNQMRAAEAVVLERIHVPKVLEVAIIDGDWTIVSEYIEGKTILELMNENPEKHQEYISTMVDVQIELSSCSSGLLTPLLEKARKKIALTDLPEDTKDELLDKVDTLPVHTKLCHGDFNPENIILAADGQVYVIDWSHATQGNLSADVARSYLWLLYNNGKETADMYLDTFCIKSGVSSGYVKSFIRVVAAASIAKAGEGEKEFLYGCAANSEEKFK